MNRFFLPILTALAVFTTATSSAAEKIILAEESLSTEEAIYFSEEELVIAPAKHKVKLKEAPANVVVVTGEEIRRSGALNLAEALRKVAGLDVKTITSGESVVSIRGFAHREGFSQRVAVYIDGRTIYSDFMGSTGFNNLPVPLEDIKRVEIIKGPMSSLYGNKAILGVINIITQHPPEATNIISGGGGTQRYAKGTFINAGKFREDFAYKISGHYERMDEWNDVTGDGRDKDLENLAGRFQLCFRPTEEAHLGLDAGITDSTTVLSTNGLNPWDIRRGYVLSRWEQDFGEYGQTTIQGFWDRNDSKSKGGGTSSPGGTMDVTDIELRYRNAFDIHKNFKESFTLGFNFRLLDYSPELPAGVPNIYDYAVFLQNEFRLFEKFIITGGFRLDYQKDYAKTNTAFQGSLVWLAHPRITLRSSISTAFNLPTPVQQMVTVPGDSEFAPWSGETTVGNSALGSEKIIYFETGAIIRPIDRIKIDLAFFYYRLNRIIEPYSWITLTGTFVSFKNNGGASALGGEIGVESEIIKKWLVGYINWAYENFKSINGNTNPTENLGNPRNKFNLGFKLDTRFHLTADLNYSFVQVHKDQGNSLYDYPRRGPVNVEALHLLNMRVAWWPVADHLELSANLNNILNDRSPQQPYLDTERVVYMAEKPGFNAFGNLMYKF